MPVTDSARGSNQTGLRAHNERLVLTLIRRMGPLAKAEIARMTGLSAQTVSVIMRLLEAEGLLKKRDPVRGKVGQPSVPMDLAADGAYFLGLKIGRRSLDLVLTDFLGQVAGRVHMTHLYPDPDRVVQFTNDAIGQLLGDLTQSQRKRVAGLGIAMPFRLWDWALMPGMRASAMEGWRDRDIAAEIAGNRDFPVYLCNDASAACGAELAFGQQDRPPTFLYFYIGYFVGGGIVIDNALFTGRSGNAAALGSVPLRVAGNQVQQLVDVASLAALEEKVMAAGVSGDAIWENHPSWSLPEPVLDDWLTSAADGLANAVISSACVIDFDCVFVDGWLPEAVRAELVRRIRSRLAELRVAGIDKPEIREGTIGSDARALGAASLPLSNRFLVDRNAFLKG